MYKNIFINSTGSNLYTTLGFLDKIKKETKDITIWNVTGNASLILFFKLLGLTATQTFDKLKKLEIVNSLINGHSLFPENEGDKKDFILDYLNNSCKDNIIDMDISLKKIQTLTGITACFLVWNRSLKKIENLNPNDYPDIKLKDAILASLTNIGVYKEHSIYKNVYSSLANIDPLPISHSYYDNIDEFLYLVNIGEYKKDYCLYNNLGPLKSTEDEFLLQKEELTKFRSGEVLNKLPNSENIAKIYSIFSRGNSKEEEKSSLFILGHSQAVGFLQGTDTHKVYKEYLESVYSQR